MLLMSPGLVLVGELGESLFFMAHDIMTEELPYFGGNNFILNIFIQIQTLNESVII